MLHTHQPGVSDPDFLPIVARTWCRHHLYFRQSDRSAGYLIVVLMCVSLMADFYVLICRLCIFFSEMSLHLICPFSDWNV